MNLRLLLALGLLSLSTATGCVLDVESDGADGTGWPGQDGPAAVADEDDDAVVLDPEQAGAAAIAVTPGAEELVPRSDDLDEGDLDPRSRRLTADPFPDPWFDHTDD